MVIGMKENTISKNWEESELAALQVGDVLLSDWQTDRLKQFVSQGFPTRHIEHWKYTPVREIEKHAFKRMQPSSTDFHSEIHALTDAYLVVFVNGHFQRDASRLPKEIELSDLRATPWHEQLSRDSVYQTPFSLLNDALFTTGYVWMIPPNVHVDRPIHVIHLTQHESTVTMDHPRNLWVISENASATVFEEYRGENGVVYFNNVVTHIDAQAGARLHFYKLQQEGDRAFHIANTIIRQARNSAVYTYNVSLGAKLSRDDLNFSLNEPGTQCELLGYYHSKGESVVDHHVRIDHRVPHGESRQNYKGIIDEGSSAVFNGKILVHPEAQKVTATQSNKNLLLSPSAEVNAKPELEIYADDVKCTHGATIGQLDEEALFYLRSRGIKEAVARHLLTCAFADDILEALPHPLIAAAIKQRVVDRLATGHCVGDCHHG